MAKKDYESRQNIDRQGEEEKKGYADESCMQQGEQAASREETQVKNASASGMGSMGRNDEGQSGPGAIDRD